MSSLSSRCTLGGEGGVGNDRVVSLTDTRASCRAKSEARAKRISEREARKEVDDVPLLRQLELDEEEDENEVDESGFGGEVCAIEKVSALDERLESCWPRLNLNGGEVDG